LFRGPDPVFIDLLSFERRRPGDPVWLPYAQFVRTFLLPLLANKHFGVTLDRSLMTRPDGLEPEEVYRWTGSLQRLKPPFLSLVSLPTWLGSKTSAGQDSSIYRKTELDNPAKAEYVLRALLDKLRRQLAKLAPVADRRSGWSDYMVSN